MKILTRLETAVKKRSNARPSSLVLHIPARVRDLMELEHNTPILLDVCMDENNQKCIKISKLD